MATAKRDEPLQVEQDLTFQHWQWIAQRCAWVVFLLVLVAALLGLFGHGPFSQLTANTPDGGLRVDYDRFLRRTAPATLTLTFTPSTAPDGVVRLGVDRTYFRGVRVLSITPTPEREEAGPDREVFVFRVASAGQPAEVQMHLEPDEMGSLSGQFRVNDGPGVDISQFVYP